MRYPPNWPSISRERIARAQYRCEECRIEEGTIVRKRRARGSALEIVSAEEYLALKEEYNKKQEALREEQHEQVLEDERRYLTPDRLNDLAFRMQLAESVKDKQGWTVMVDPDERYGFYSEGDYYPHSDFDDDDIIDSEYTQLLRELSALGLARILLQTNHIDCNPSNCDDSNLEALCQFCHGSRPPKPKRIRRR